MTKIYAISDPFTHIVRYVGRTEHDLDHRLRSHMSVALRGKTASKFSQFLRTLTEWPHIILLQEVPFEEAVDAENFWMSRFADLLNSIPSRTLNLKSWKAGDRMADLAGTMLDREVAEIVGVRPASVCVYRKNRGIPALGNDPKIRDLTRSRGHWYELPLDIRDQLGKRSDRSIARDSGLPQMTITRRRRELGIPPWSPKGGA